MAITKLSITGNTTAVGISSTPIVVSLGNTAEATTVTPSGNITATSVQTALQQIDTIKVQASGGTLTNPSISGNVSITGDITSSTINLGDTNLSSYKESTWTPTLYGSTSGNVIISPSESKYTKIGNLVFFTSYINNIEAVSHNAVGSLYIGGLPFAANCSTSINNLTYSNSFTFDEASNPVCGYVVSGQTYIALTRGSDEISVSSNDLVSSDTTGFYISGTYLTDS